jgi:hypothetical protein
MTAACTPMQALDPNKGTGWDIAALSDADPDYAGSCGRCYEGGSRAQTQKGARLRGLSDAVVPAHVADSCCSTLLIDPCMCGLAGSASNNFHFCEPGPFYHMLMVSPALAHACHSYLACFQSHAWMKM